MKNFLKVIVKIFLIIFLSITIIDVFYITKPYADILIFKKGEIINENQEGSFSCINGPYKLDRKSGAPFLYSPCTFTNFIADYSNYFILGFIIFSFLAFLTPWSLLTYPTIIVLFIYFWRKKKEKI